MHTCRLRDFKNRSLLAGQAPSISEVSVTTLGYRRLIYKCTAQLMFVIDSGERRRSCLKAPVRKSTFSEKRPSSTIHPVPLEAFRQAAMEDRDAAAKCHWIPTAVNSPEVNHAIRRCVILQACRSCLLRMSGIVQPALSFLPGYSRFDGDVR